MIITIDILSLGLGIFIGVFVTMIGIICTYFDDRWDTAFGSGWQQGCEYGKKTAEKERKINETN